MILLHFVFSYVSNSFNVYLGFTKLFIRRKLPLSLAVLLSDFIEQMYNYVASYGVFFFKFPFSVAFIRPFCIWCRYLCVKVFIACTTRWNCTIRVEKAGIIGEFFVLCANMVYLGKIIRVSGISTITYGEK